MSPEAAVITFGRTRAQALRGAFWLALLGSAVVLGLERMLTREGTPAGEALRRVGIPPGLPLLIGIACVLGIAAYGYAQSTRRAGRFSITDAGLEVENHLGRFCLEWKNVREMDVARGDALGIKVVDRERVLATHRGNPAQREWLRTQEPFGEWDFLFDRADLGHPAATVRAWLAERLTP